MELSNFANIRTTGIIAMTLDDGDSLDWARLTDGESEFMVVTRSGKALRFDETLVRSMGRTAGGVRAMKLLGDDHVVSLDVLRPDCDLLVLHEKGWGKRTPLEEFNAKGRNTQGNWVTDHKRLDEIGPVVAARVVHPLDEVTIITTNGITMRTPVTGISQYGRMTRGVRIVSMKGDDTVAALAVMDHQDLQIGVDGEGQTPPNEQSEMNNTQMNGVEMNGVEMNDVEMNSGDTEGSELENMDSEIVDDEAVDTESEMV
jgi:DNA gyrase subunit A